MPKLNLIATTAVAAALFATAASSAVIDVLWTAGTEDYNASITDLAANAGGYDPDSNGSNTWNITMWDGTSDPNFGNYDVFVIGSTCNTSSTGICGGGGAGFYGNGVTAAGVLTYGAEIANARGNRTFLSGQDADYHHTNNLPNVDNGPRGFMINAVNWAASGTGMGIVSMTDRINNDDGWWTAENSFLAAELAGGPFALNSNSVSIGAGQESFPINEGLTSAGLSNWRTSSHACFNEVDDYARINFAPYNRAQCGVTIVTEGEEGGGTNPVVPLPASGWLMIAAFGAMAARRKFR